MDWAGRMEAPQTTQRPAGTTSTIGDRHYGDRRRPDEAVGGGVEGLRKGTVEPLLKQNGGPGCEFVVLEGIGHLPPMQDPKRFGRPSCDVWRNKVVLFEPARRACFQQYLGTYILPDNPFPRYALHQQNAQTTSIISATDTPPASPATTPRHAASTNPYIQSPPKSAGSGSTRTDSAPARAEQSGD